MKKLNLRKKVVSVLTDEEKQFINGGEGTTSYSECTKFICCDQNPSGTVLTQLTTCKVDSDCESIVITSYC